MNLLGQQWSRSPRALSAARGYIEGMQDPARPNVLWQGWKPKAGYPRYTDDDDLADLGEQETVSPFDVTPGHGLIASHVSRHFEDLVAGRSGQATPGRNAVDEPIQVVARDNLTVLNGNHRLMAHRLAGKRVNTELYEDAVWE